MAKQALKPEPLITEPTDKMIEAGAAKFRELLLTSKAESIVSEVYKAMDAAR